MWVVKPMLDIDNIYSSKERAEAMNRLDVLPYHVIVPLTITYNVPHIPRTGKNKKIVHIKASYIFD